MKLFLLVLVLEKIARPLLVVLKHERRPHKISPDERKQDERKLDEGKPTKFSGMI